MTTRQDELGIWKSVGDGWTLVEASKKLKELQAVLLVADEEQRRLDNNAVSIEDLMRAALAANKKFLALEKPLTADVVAQVRLLTREVSGLIRRELSEFGEVE